MHPPSILAASSAKARSSHDELVLVLRAPNGC